MKAQKASPRRTAVLVIAFLVGALVLGLLVVRRYQVSQSPPPVPAEPSAASTRLVALFFAAADADGLVREGREIDACSPLEECIRSVLQELQNGPVGDSDETLSESAPLPAVTVTGSLAILDLSPELVAELPGGSAGELNTVYSLVNTITVNFPQIRQVQLLVAGQQVESLKGHLDIRTPLSPDLSREKHPLPQPSPAAGTPRSN